ncbi:hypothetical protein [Acidovorax cavernicola]|uniref:Uncharacterized protein n=1 Tax=Acidovorax cavernicola TaxID=1675792 RepID=A0A9X8GWQ4_9BURK|nr:hypothetical protein [Acidovorax cavernicola]RIX83595.1 hypothetical protein D3H34_06260 [Acidovorax cavernicola]
MQDLLTSYFWHGDTLRSRSVSGVVHSALLDVPEPPARLVADWQREIATNVPLEPGDVETMPLARARTRWPDYAQCVQAMSDWLGALGLPATLLPASDVALMACRGARYHHDGAQYGGAAFCNLFLSEDKGLDVHFPVTGHRVALTRGTALLFDTGQPHAVVPRGSHHGFDAADFPDGQDHSQLFLTWELSLEDAQVAGLLGIGFDVDPIGASQLDEEQVRVNGEQAEVCPNSGRWRIGG